MKPWLKWTLIISAVLLALALTASVFIYRTVSRTVPDCYAQWATAELIIAYRKDKNKMPESWQDIQPYQPQALHHGGLTFEEIQKRIQIDFPSLPVLEKAYPDKNSIPKVIKTKSGEKAFWDGAEPNQLVNSEIQK